MDRRSDIDFVRLVKRLGVERVPQMTFYVGRLDEVGNRIAADHLWVREFDIGNGAT